LRRMILCSTGWRHEAGHDDIDGKSAREYG
jgi:hypothetical protein